MTVTFPLTLATIGVSISAMCQSEEEIWELSALVIKNGSLTFCDGEL